MALENNILRTISVGLLGWSILSTPAKATDYNIIFDENKEFACLKHYQLNVFPKDANHPFMDIDHRSSPRLIKNALDTLYSGGYMVPAEGIEFEEGITPMQACPWTLLRNGSVSYQVKSGDTIMDVLKEKCGDDYEYSLVNETAELNAKYGEIVGESFEARKMRVGDNILLPISYRNELINDELVPIPYCDSSNIEAILENLTDFEKVRRKLMAMEPEIPVYHDFNEGYRQYVQKILGGPLSYMEVQMPDFMTKPSIFDFKIPHREITEKMLADFTQTDEPNITKVTQQQLYELQEYFNKRKLEESLAGPLSHLEVYMPKTSQFPFVFNRQNTTSDVLGNNKEDKSKKTIIDTFQLVNEENRTPSVYFFNN